jgi:integrase
MEKKRKQYQEASLTDPYSLFVYAIRTQITRNYYLRRLRTFFDYIKLLPNANIERRCNHFAAKATKDHNWTFSTIISFLQYQKDRVEREEITAATLYNFVKALKLFCEMSDVPIAWKKITRGLPKVRSFANDRAPTIEEIRKMTEYPDRRMKAIVYTMASSGIRLGAWDYLRWNDIEPVSKDGRVVAGKLTVYAGEEDEYFSFVTPEALSELERWISYRKQSGEVIDKNTWVMRQLWNTKEGYYHGIVTEPIKLKSSGIKRLIERNLWSQGIRKKLTLKEIDTNFKPTTDLENGLRPDVNLQE